MNYYIRAFKNYTNFKGRDTRPQFWYFYLVHFIISTFLFIIDEYIVGQETFLPVYSLLIILPLLAAMSRRLHDTGKSAWWILVISLAFPIGLSFLFLIIGIIIYFILPNIVPILLILLPILLVPATLAYFIYMFSKKGEDKPNKYGDIPKNDEVSLRKDADNKEEKHHEKEKINESENKENLESNDENQLNQG